MERIMKVGLLGGSFNPIHVGHIKIAKSSLESKLVDEVWIMPCKNHAFDKPLANGEDRINMTKLAIKDINGVKLSKIEMEADGKNYTIDTLRTLRKKYNHEFFLIVGSDILYEIQKWKDYQELMKIAEFIISKRKDYPIKEVEGIKIKCLLEEDTGYPSSTEIRERIRKGESLKDLVPESVEKYIIERGLYK